MLSIQSWMDFVHRRAAVVNAFYGQVSQSNSNIRDNAEEGLQGLLSQLGEGVAATAERSAS
jgi:hypothetical protein